MNKNSPFKKFFVIIFSFVLLSAFFVKTVHHHQDLAEHPNCLICHLAHFSANKVSQSSLSLVVPIDSFEIANVEILQFFTKSIPVFRISPATSPPFV